MSRSILIITLKTCERAAMAPGPASSVVLATVAVYFSTLLHESAKHSAASLLGTVPRPEVGYPSALGGQEIAEEVLAGCPAPVPCPLPTPCPESVTADSAEPVFSANNSSQSCSDSPSYPYSILSGVALVAAGVGFGSGRYTKKERVVVSRVTPPIARSSIKSSRF